MRPEGKRVTGGARVKTGATSCTSSTTMTMSSPAIFRLSCPGSANASCAEKRERKKIKAKSYIFVNMIIFQWNVKNAYNIWFIYEIHPFQPLAAAWVRGQDNLFNFCSKQEKREKNVIETVECCSPLESLPNLKLTLVNDRRAIKDQFQCDINEMEFFRLKNISLAPMFDSRARTMTTTCVALCRCH